MSSWLKLSHYKHSGKLRPHVHTSYLPLLGLLVVVFFPLLSFTAYALHPGPQSGSVSVSGVMPGKAPTVAPVILTPSEGKHFSTSPITVSGTCPSGLIVEVFKSDIFAGSAICTSAGTFSLDVDLLVGPNVLLARAYDALNQASPDSNSVNVTYDILPAQSSPITSLNFGGAQLVLSTQAVYRGVFPGQSLSVPIGLLGGTAPYAVNVSWGDSQNTVVSRSDNIQFTSTHVYQKAGTYQMTIQATDSNGRVAFLSVAVIVNGQPDPAVSGTTTTNNKSFYDLMIKALALWPLYMSSIAVVISFWLGERREKKILGVQYAPIS